MATKLIHKNSKVQFKNATGAQLEFGELALNYHATGPYLQAKGEDGSLHSLGGVYIGSSAPSNPLPGRWWFDDANSKLFLHDGSAWQAVTGSGGGGSSTTVVGGDGIIVTTSGSTATVAVDLASSANGLLISSGKLQAHIATASDLGTVKIGDGIDVDAAGEISVDLSGVDVNADLEYVPNGNSNATITNTAGDDATVPIATDSVAGLFTGDEKQKLAGIEDGAAANQDLGYTADGNNAGTVTITDGTDATVPIVTDTVAGLMTGTQKQKLDGIEDGAQVNDGYSQAESDDRYLRIDAGAPDQTRVSGEATFAELTTHEAGANITTGTVDDPGIFMSPDPYIGVHGDGAFINITNSDESQSIELHSDGTASFSQLTTHAGGVSVTGGNNTTISHGISGTRTSGGSERIYINCNGTPSGRFNSSGLYYSGNDVDYSFTSGSIKTVFAGYVTGGQPNRKISNLFCANYASADLTASTKQNLVYAIYRVDDDTAGNADAINYYSLGESPEQQQVSNVSGFRSTLSIGTGTNRFNFYAEGSAPNYFAGNVGIGTDDPQGKLDVDGNAFFRNVIVSNGIRSVSDDQVANWGGNQAAKYYASGGSATHGSQGFTADSIGAGTDNEAIHFLSRGTDSDNNNNYSFRTSLDNSTGTGKNYAFYAEGSAPNYFAGNTFVSSSTSIDDFNASNNEDKNGVYLSRFGSFICKISQNDPTAGFTVFGKRTGLSELSNFQDTIARFSYGKRSTDPDDQTGVAYTIKGDGTGGIVAEVVSDYRTKENVVDLPSAVDAIKALRPINYNYTWAPGSTRPGFIAHELQETLPAAVIGTKDAEQAIGTLYDFDGTVLETEVTEPYELTYTEKVVDESQPTIEGQEPRMVEVTRTRTWTASGTRPVYQGVDQTKLIPLLTKALQEALERIEQLEAQLGAGGGSDFESRVAALETDMARFKAI